jgi:TolB-like protein
MRFIALVLFALASFLTVSYSNAALPITAMAGNPEPTTAPATRISVMLLPFNAVGQSGESNWISQAIDEDLSHDLARNSAIRVVRPSTTQPLKDGDGLTAARGANADRLVSGSYQVVDNQLRVTGEVIDVKQTQSIAQIKATGPVRNLFQLEDELSMQLWHILPQADRTGSVQTSAADFQVTPLEDYTGSQAAPQVYQPQPEVASAPAQAPVYDYPDDSPYDSVYPYAGYGYGYPYGFGLPLFIYGGYGNHGGYHHGGDNHGHFGGGGSVTAGHVGSPHVFTPSAAMHAGGGNFVGHR